MVICTKKLAANQVKTYTAIYSIGLIMWLRVSCDLEFDIPTPLPFVLMLRPSSGAQQWVTREECTLKPYVPVMEFTDEYGNLCQRLTAPQGSFSIITSAEIMTADTVEQGFGPPFTEIQNLPNEVLSYLLPSRYCESERFRQLATEMTNGQRAGSAIVRWLKENIHYRPGSSNISVSAVEVNLNSYGVCRDADIYNQYRPPIYPKMKHVKVEAFTPTEPRLISTRAAP